MAIEKLKCHNLPVIVQIPAELLKAEDTTICWEIHIFIISLWNREELYEE